MGRLRSAAGALGYGVRRQFGKALLTAGLAGAAIGAAAQEVTIAALGDSLTQGYGLEQGDGFVPQLEAWLQARGGAVRLLNAGVSGDTTAGGLARVGWTLTPEIDAMIVALGGNDLLRGLPPEVTRANLEGILQAAAEADVEVLLIGMQAPGNYGPDYKASFDAIFPALAAEFDVLLVESFLAPVAEASNGGAALTAYMQGDGIHPNRDGVARIVEAVGPSVEALMARAAQP